MNFMFEWKIRHSVPGCSFVWILRVVHFPVNHPCLYNKKPLLQHQAELLNTKYRQTTIVKVPLIFFLQILGETLSTLQIRAGSSAIRRALWLFNSPVLASCQSPGDIAHGKKFGSDYSHNKTVRYECDAEYTLEGKNRLTCNDGKWNYNPPQCKGKKAFFVRNVNMYGLLTKFEVTNSQIYFWELNNQEGVGIHTYAKKKKEKEKNTRSCNNLANDQFTVFFFLVGQIG